MSTIQIPVLFDVAGSANILGETQTSVMSHHLTFDISGVNTTKATDNFASSFSVDLFNDAFLIGDTDDTDDKFFYAKSSTSVQTFAKNLAGTLLYGLYDQGAVAAGSDVNKIPIGGREVTPGDDYPYYTDKIAAAGDQDYLSNVMGRVAAVHLSGHPLAQVLFTDENSIEKGLTGDTVGGVTDVFNVKDMNDNDVNLFSTLAQQLYTVFGGKSLETENFTDKSSNDLLLKANGTANGVLKSILEQCLAVSGRTTDISGILDPSGDDTKTQVGSIPIKEGDTIVIYLRPSIEFTVDVAGVAVTDASANGHIVDGTGTVLSVATHGIAGNEATAISIPTVFPGSGSTGVVSETYPWMGASNGELSQISTNYGDTYNTTLDCHIWKLSIKLTAAA